MLVVQPKRTLYWTVPFPLKLEIAVLRTLDLVQGVAGNVHQLRQAVKQTGNGGPLLGDGWRRALDGACEMRFGDR